MSEGDKTLSEKIDEYERYGDTCDVNIDKIREDFEVTVRDVNEMVENVLPLLCMRDEKDPDNCSCIACVRDTMRNEVKRILKNKFGFEK